MCIACDDQCVGTSALTPNQTQKNHDPTLASLPKKRRSRARRVTFANCPDEEPITPTTNNNTSHLHTPKNMKDSVRAEIIATIPASSTMSQEELSSIHWQPNDYALFRGSARVIAQEVRKVSTTTQQKSRSYNSVLSRTLEICHIVSQDKTRCSSASDDDHVQVDMCLPPRLFGALTDWTREGHSRRGIERYCVESHEGSRPLARQQAIEAVLVTQELMKQKGFQSGMFQVGGLTLPSTLSNEEITKRVSQEFTRYVWMYVNVFPFMDVCASFV